MLGESRGMRKLALVLAVVFPACGSELPAPVATAAAARSEPAAAALPDGRTAEERRAIFRSGVEAEAAGRADLAEAAFARSLATYPELADHARIRLARLTAKRGDAARAMEHWSALAERHPDSVWRGEAALAIAEERIERDDVATAERWLAIARADDLRSEIRARATWLSSQLARRRGDLAKARALGEEVRTTYAGTPEAREAANQAWAERDAIAFTSFDTAKDEANRLLKEGEPARALELIRAAEGRFSNHPSLPDLWLLEATALARTGPGEQAIQLLQDIRRRAPRHPAAATALYRIASGAWNKDEDDRARALFSEYDRLYPDGANAAESLYAAGRIDQEAKRWKDAAWRFARLASRHKQSTLAAESAFRVGWSRYRDGAYADAARSFDEAASRGLEEAGSIYWRGRSLDRSGRSGAASYAEVLERFPESYYAYRAEERLGRPIGQTLRERMMPEALPNPTPPFQQVHWTRSEELRQAGLLDLARLELDAYLRATQVDSSHSPWLIAAWQKIGGWDRAIRIAIREAACSIEKPIVRACYPLGYWTELRTEASRRNLDPHLIASLIRQESLFDAKAHSPANARGLMQLLPSTAERVARKSGLRYGNASELYRPEINLPLGSSYLAELLERYDGSTVSALAAYNAGEGAVAKWQQRYPGLEEDEFVESISYRETRNYVKKVLQNRRLYRTLYGTS
jgi:soluble lytic murein transglycosylase